MNEKDFEYIGSVSDYNKEFGLSFLGNSEKIYNNLLINYISNYGDVSKRIEKFLSEGNYLKIREIIHKIRGISSNLGSVKLYELSAFLDEKMLIGTSNLDKYIEKYILYHQKFLEKLKENV